MTGLLYLDSCDVARACAELDPLECVAEALRLYESGRAEVPGEAVLRWSPPEGGMARTLNMPGLLRGTGLRVGTKIINGNTQNPSRGLPRADGVVLLFDPVTAHPVAIMQGAAISSLRTAAVSTLAALHLRSSAPAVLGLIGAGAIARAHLDLMGRYLELEDVLVYDLLPERAAALASGVAGGRCVGDAEEAVREANIVVTATTTTTPYIPYDWLSPGTVAVNVSLDDLEEDAYLRADRLYVDDWNLVVEDSQRLLGKLARRGAVTGPGGNGSGRPVDGTIGQLVAGTCPGRENQEQIMVVNPFGLAIEDIAIAGRVYEIALARNYGTLLPH